MNLSKLSLLQKLLVVVLILNGCVCYSDNNKLINHAVIDARYNSNKSNAPFLTIKETSIEEIKNTRKIPKKIEWEFPIYILETEGFTPGKSYQFFSMDVLSQKQFGGEFVATESGKLVSKKENKPLDEYIFSGGGFMNGEPAYYILLANDGSLCKAVMTTPNPIQSYFSDGAHMSLIMTCPETPTFSLVCSGFKPDEQLIFDSKSCHESIQANITANADGTIYMGMMPSVKGENGGKASIKITRSDSSSGTLEYWWGIDAANHKQKSANHNKLKELINWAAQGSNNTSTNCKLHKE